MTPQQLADHLTGREYGNEITKDDIAEAKQSGLVIIRGASDDLVEIDGAFSDELGAYEGKTFYLHRGGVLTDPSGGECEHCNARTMEVAKKCAKVKAIWGDRGYSWMYETEAPHATFEVVEDGGPYCRGIVLSVADLPEVTQ